MNHDPEKAAKPMTDTAVNETRATPWAVCPETIPMISNVVRAISAEERQRLTTQAISAAAAEPRVAGAVMVLSIQGLITPKPSFLSLLFGGGGGLIMFQQMFREAVASDEIGAIVLDIDSPGGRVDLVPEVAAEIRAARGSKPIVAVANTMAASAAYWLASQADELVVTPSGQVGSIGVFIAHEDWSKFDEQLGVATTLISAGKYKTDGNPYEPLSDSAREAFQESVDTLYDMFVNDVAAGRGISADTVRSGFGEGRVELASRALELGMVDRVATLDDTIARLVSGENAAAAAAAALHRAEAARPAPQVTVDEPSLEAEAGSDRDDEVAMTAEQRRRMADVLLG